MSESSPPQSTQQVIFVENGEALRAVLQQHGFDISQWGIGPTKTVEALWEEVVQGETEILEIAGQLVRRTYVAAVDVTAHTSDGSRYRLREEKQIYTNGSERRRELITSLAEKIKPQETTTEAVKRAIKEELGIQSPITITEKGQQILEKASQTFGGMPTQLALRLTEVEIAEADFRTEGYVEHQPEKSVYFVWEQTS